MRWLMQIGAVLTMLLAGVEIVALIPELLNDPSPVPRSAPSYSESDPQPRQPPPSTFVKIAQRAARICELLYPRAALFCLGAILFVLIRISKMQEVEVEALPDAPAPTSAGEPKA